MYHMSYPARFSPLSHMYKITDTYDSSPLRNPITPKASLPGHSWVFASPELHQHFVRDRLVPHPRRRVNVGKLEEIAFVSSPKSLFLRVNLRGGRTRHRVHLETKFISVPSSRESLFGDITSSLITSSTNGTPAPQNTIFGRNLNVVVRGQFLSSVVPIHGARAHMHAHLSMGTRLVFHKSSIAPILSPPTSPLAHRLTSFPTFSRLSSLTTSRGNPSWYTTLASRSGHVRVLPHARRFGPFMTRWTGWPKYFERTWEGEGEAGWRA